GTLWMAMEYEEGSMDLARLVDEKGRLSVRDACHYIRQAALGLQYAFEKEELVHRDLKPHNLLLTRSGVVKLLDLGLANFREAETLTRTGDNGLMGTADYIAPEQVDDAHVVDIRAVIYSLGCTLYHLLAGEPPFAKPPLVAKPFHHQTKPPPALEGFRTDLPPGLIAVVGGMLAKRPHERFAQPVDVAQALAPFCEEPVLRVLPIPALTLETGQTIDFDVRLERRHSQGKVQLRLEALPRGLRYGKVSAERDA